MLCVPASRRRRQVVSRFIGRTFKTVSRKLLHSVLKEYHKIYVAQLQDVYTCGIRSKNIKISLSDVHIIYVYIINDHVEPGLCTVYTTILSEQ